VEAAYFKPPNNTDTIITEAPLGLLVPTWILVALNFYFGISATVTGDYAIKTATTLLGSG
jgi:multicomponent Na+:H+ antiporter subunit D